MGRFLVATFFALTCGLLQLLGGSADAAQCVPPGRVSVVSPVQGALVPVRPLLKWSAAARAVRYRYQVRERADSPVVASRAVTAREFKLRYPLKEQARYIWRVRGLNGCGPGPWSAFGRFRTSGNVAACPVDQAGLCKLAASVNAAIRSHDPSAFYSLIRPYASPCLDNDQFLPDCNGEPPGTKVDCIGLGPLAAGFDCLSRPEFEPILARMQRVYAVIYPRFEVPDVFVPVGPAVVLEGDIAGVYIGLEARRTASGWSIVGAYSTAPGNLSAGAFEFTVCPDDRTACIPTTALARWPS